MGRMSTSPAPGARAAARRRVREALTSSARSLVAAEGFDGTTIDMITAGAGVSRRTFFRYFDTKESVLLDAYESLGAHIVAALRARPSGERPWPAMRHAFVALAPSVDNAEHRSAERALHAVYAASPRLLAKRQERRQATIAACARVLVAREAEAGRDLTPAEAAAVAGAAFACFAAAESRFLDDDGVSAVEALDAMLARLDSEIRA